MLWYESTGGVRLARQISIFQLKFRARLYAHRTINWNNPIRVHQAHQIVVLRTNWYLLLGFINVVPHALNRLIDELGTCENTTR